ncbi:hypothetical protein H7H73_24440, partial [Mycobacterium rufum]|nr:hypothetical protein [Mycolicibacterium rufum]
MTPVALPATVLAEAWATARALTAMTGAEVDADEVLGGRAVALDLPRGGTVSAGGATRLMGADDDWCALTLARPDDLARRCPRSSRPTTRRTRGRRWARASGPPACMRS